MDTSWVVVIIVLVLGVVIGNITLLKYSAKFKFPQEVKDQTQKHKDNNKNGNGQAKKGFDDEEDEW